MNVSLYRVHEEFSYFVTEGNSIYISRYGQPNPPSIGGVGCADARQRSRCLASTKTCIVRYTYVTLYKMHGVRGKERACYFSHPSCLRLYQWLRTKECLRACFKLPNACPPHTPSRSAERKDCADRFSYSHIFFHASLFHAGMYR